MERTERRGAESVWGRGMDHLLSSSETDAAGGLREHKDGGLFRCKARALGLQPAHTHGSVHAAKQSQAGPGVATQTGHRSKVTQKEERGELSGIGSTKRGKRKRRRE